MQYKKDIQKALKELELRKADYLLDIAEIHSPGSIKYDTELIRKLEVVDAQIFTLRWVLAPKDKAKK